VETFAYELQGDPFARLSATARGPQLSLDPLSASGLSIGTLNAFSKQMSERHGQAAPDMIASQWAQFFPPRAGHSPRPAGGAQPATDDRPGPVRA
jgi:hypothetical protein